MKKSLTSLFALAFALMFGMVHVASAEKHMAPAAKTEGAAADGKKEEMKTEKKVKKEKKMKKKAAKKEMNKEGAATPATPAAPAAK